ncbi:hypothetical protein [Pseudomonas sp. PSKL.D1]|uniref:hypothetical protein n=1 Tax=Pseudomonas sp. PSKL.D1 TaxID=3029060 RepID=UPI002381307B|nr:hypothetical protein [Pseudomonas sp. PSKL.D1]WDY60227.1 hypothetical protein PVV54_11560 [Pseudomonas sp. PSKL.D1]
MLRKYVLAVAIGAWVLASATGVSSPFGCSVAYAKDGGGGHGGGSGGGGGHGGGNGGGGDMVVAVAVTVVVAAAAMEVAAVGTVAMPVQAVVAVVETEPMTGPTTRPITRQVKPTVLGMARMTA